MYCKDEYRRATYANERFDFLGYTFRPRLSKSRVGKHFVNFSPAVSDDALKAMSRELWSWRLNCRSDKALGDLARMFNKTVQGWINYYGRFYKSRLYPLFRRMNEYLVRWAKRKYKRLYGHTRRAKRWLVRVARREPTLFAHWRLGVRCREHRHAPVSEQHRELAQKPCGHYGYYGITGNSWMLNRFEQAVRRRWHLAQSAIPATKIDVGAVCAVSAGPPAAATHPSPLDLASCSESVI